MTQKALQIGINYIGTSSELKGCINDVLNIRNFLIQEGYKPENIKVMTEASNDPLLIPTADNIMRELGWLKDGATSQSKLFLTYSGHGGSIVDAGGDESDKRDETICPLDYEEKGQITDDILRAYLIDKLPAGCQLTCLIDSCHSGTVMDLKYNWVGSKRLPGTYTMIVNKSKITRAKIICISGCRDEQYSADTYEDGKNQGAMTYAFLSTMKESGRKRNRNSFTNKNLIQRMDTLLKRKKYDQVPQLSSGRSIDLNSNFTII